MSKVPLEKVASIIKKAERICGAIISCGIIYYLHSLIMVSILKKLGIDIFSYPDTLEYRLALGYLLLTQIGYLFWISPKFIRFMDFVVIPIKKIADLLESWLEKRLEMEKPKE